jgi:replicative DNA helicase
MAVAITSEVKLISAIVNSGNLNPALARGVKSEWFQGYKIEFDWLYRRYTQIKHVPKVGDFRGTFPGFPLQEDMEDVDLYTEEVRDAHARQTLRTGLGEAAQCLMTDNTLALDGAMETLYTAVRQAEAVRTGVTGVNLVKDAKLTMKTLQALHQQAQTTGHVGWYTGYGTIDRVSKGLKPGWYVVWASRMKTGKTWSLIKTALNMARDGARVGFFSTEMNALSVYLRMISIMRYEQTRGASTWNSSLLGNGLGFKPLEMETFLKQLQKTIKGSLEIYDQRHGAFTPAAIQAKAEAEGLDVCVVDYLGQIRPSKSLQRAEVWQTTKEVSGEFQGIAQGDNLLIVTANQINRSGAEFGPPPPLSALSGSDAVAQDADMIITMARQSPQGRVRQALVAGNRHGEDGVSFWLVLDGAIGRWEEISYQEASGIWQAEQHQQTLQP